MALTGESQPGQLPPGGSAPQSISLHLADSSSFPHSLVRGPLALPSKLQAYISVSAVTSLFDSGLEMFSDFKDLRD